MQIGVDATSDNMNANYAGASRTVAATAQPEGRGAVATLRIIFSVMLEQGIKLSETLWKFQI